MLHVRHAAAAIEAGLCKTVLITHAESGKSMIGKLPRLDPSRQFARPVRSAFGGLRSAQHVPDPRAGRYMKTYGITHEQIAMVSVVQREWAAKNPRAMMKEPITVADVLNSRMIAYPFRILQCCLVTDGGGALILTSADRARDFPQKPVYILGNRRERRDADGQPDGNLLTHRGHSRSRDRPRSVRPVLRTRMSIT